MARLLDTTTYFPHYWRNMSEAETLTRRRALAAVTVLFVAGVVAGCSSSATEAPKPTDRPTEAPAPSLLVTPIPVATPTPVVTIAPAEGPTPTPTPEASASPSSPITVATVIADLYAGGKALDKYRKPISMTALRQSFDSFLKSPAASFMAYPGRFGLCTDPKVNIRTRQMGCIYFTFESLTAAEETADPAAIDFAQKLMRYVLTKVYVDANPHIDEEIVKNLASLLRDTLAAKQNN
jgi:hypothetical protein